MKKNSLFAVIIVLVFYGSGCTTVMPQESSTKLSVVHEIKYSNKGTRSEGRSGYLKINGKLLRDCFNLVVAGGKVYTFMSKQMIWGDDGYMPLEIESPENYWPAADKTLSDADIARGWYEENLRCTNTPQDWIFVKWSSGSASVSPDKIEELIKVKFLNDIPRNTMFDSLVKNKKH